MTIYVAFVIFASLAVFLVAAVLLIGRYEDHYREEDDDETNLRPKDIEDLFDFCDKKDIELVITDKSMGIMPKKIEFRFRSRKNGYCRRRVITADGFYFPREKCLENLYKDIKELASISALEDKKEEKENKDV